MAKVMGRQALLKKLAAMPPEVRRAAAVAIEDGAQTIVKTQKSLVQVEDGDLKASIKYTKGSVEFKNSGVLGRPKDGVSMQGDPDLTIWITAGDEKAFWARWVENGTAPHEQPNLGVMHPGAKAYPFFYPGYRMNRKSVKSKISRRTNKAIRSVAGK